MGCATSHDTIATVIPPPLPWLSAIYFNYHQGYARSINRRYSSSTVFTLPERLYIVEMDYIREHNGFEPATGVPNMPSMQSPTTTIPLTSIQEQSLGRRLIAAVLCDNMTGMIQLLDLGANVNFSVWKRGNNRGITCLHIAAAYGKLSILVLLLRWHRPNALANEGVDAVDREAKGGVLGLTPLHVAAQNNQIGSINALCAEGVNVDSCDNNGWTPLHWASALGLLLAVRELLNSGCDRGIRTRDGDTALHLGVKGGHVDCVEYLWREGCSVDAINAAQRLPLYYAKTRDVRFLLVSDFYNPNKKVSSTLASPDLIDFINVRRISTVNELLLDGVERGSVATVCHALKMGSDPNYTIESSSSKDKVLHRACRQFGGVDVVSILISSGASVTAVNALNETPKDVIGKCLSLKLVSTPNDVVIVNKIIEESVVIRMLSESMLVNEKALRLLLSAIHRGSESGVKEALDYGASVNCKYNDGETPLHKAVRTGSYGITRQLLSRGAIPTILNNDDDSAILLAQRLRHRQLVILLGGEDLSARLTPRPRRSPSPYSSDDTSHRNMKFENSSESSRGAGANESESGEKQLSTVSSVG